MSSQDNGPKPPSPAEQEKAEFARRIEAAKDATEIAQIVKEILPGNKIDEQQGEAHPGGDTTRERDKEVQELISIGNRAGIRRFTRRVYFAALAEVIGNEDAEWYMMSPEKAEAEGRFD